MDYLDIVLEARRKKVEEKDESEDKEKVPDDIESEDYTEGAPEDSDAELEGEDPDGDDEGPPEDDEPTDYTADGDDEGPPEDDEPTDYTADGEGDEIESEEDEPIPDEDGDVEGGEDPDELESSDYTEGVDDGSDPEDGEVDTEEGVDTEETPPEDVVNSPRNRRLLLEDYTDLYFNCKSFLSKINSLDKTDMIINQSILQIDKNITRIKDSVWDYIVSDFDGNDYTVNLYKYNLFIEAFKTNIRILSRVKGYIIDYYDKGASNSKKPKKSN